MAFEGVNVMSLRASLNNIYQSLCNSKVSNLNSNIKGATNNWQALSKNKVQNALADIGTKETELKNLVDRYFTICDLIKDYKEKQATIDDYNDEISYLNRQIKKAKQKDKSTSSYEKSKDKYSKKIKSLKNDLSDIEAKVKKLI